MKSHRKNYVIIHCRSAKGYKMFQKHVHVWHHQRPFGLQYTMHWEFCTSSMVPCGLEDGLSIFKRWRPTFTHGDQPAVRGWRWTSHPHFSERLNHLHWLHVHVRYWNPPHLLTKPPCFLVEHGKEIQHCCSWSHKNWCLKSSIVVLEAIYLCFVGEKSASAWLRYSKLRKGLDKHHNLGILWDDAVSGWWLSHLPLVGNIPG